MSGTPTEAEVQAQWRNAVALLETARNFADGTIAGAGGALDTLAQSLEGEYTPAGLAGAAASFRAGLSSLITGPRSLEMHAPVIFEYAKLLGWGGGYRSVRDLMRPLYEHFVANSLTVESRAITYDTTATDETDGAAGGNGVISRLTVDQNNFALEACHVETKRFRCRRDRNNGAAQWAEEFEVLGQAAPPDAILVPSFGSGLSRFPIYSKHAGSGSAGSLLSNSSFDLYTSTNTPKFNSWTEVAGSAQITEETTNYYRSNPDTARAGTNRALRINGGGGTVTLRQLLSAMRTNRLDNTVPYFLRVMVNKTVGTASGGNVVVRVGSQTITTSIAALGADWVEILLPIGTACWYVNLNEDAEFKVEIEWASSTSGYLLVDDVILCPWDLIDGTYWNVRVNAGSPVAWLVDDLLAFTDTGGAPATAKLQYWLWRAGLGCLPSTTGTPTFTEP